MGPIPVKQRRPENRRELTALDNPEMTLILSELGEPTTLANSGRAPTASVMSPDWLNELNSATSLVLDRQEREALARELELMMRPHRIAA